MIRVVVLSGVERLLGAPRVVSIANAQRHTHHELHVVCGARCTWLEAWVGGGERGRKCNL